MWLLFAVTDDGGNPCHLRASSESAERLHASPAAAQDGDLAAELDLCGVVLLPAQHLDRHRLHPAQHRLVHL
jgi:hypothetical protein